MNEAPTVSEAPAELEVLRYTDPMRLAFERRAHSLDDGSQDPERDARADAEAQSKGIPEFYRKAIEKGKIVILPHDQS